MLINAILELHKQIQDMPLGVNRVNAAKAAERPRSPPPRPLR